MFKDGQETEMLGTAGRTPLSLAGIPDKHRVYTGPHFPQRPLAELAV